MIYHDTHRLLWGFPLGAARFFGTVASFAAFGNLIGNPGIFVCLMFAATIPIKLIHEFRLLQPGDDEDTPWSPDVHSTRLQLGPLGVILRSRIVLALLAIFVGFTQLWLALPILLLAEFFERQLIFQFLHAPQIP